MWFDLMKDKQQLLKGFQFLRNIKITWEAMKK